MIPVHQSQPDLSCHVKESCRESQPALSCHVEESCRESQTSCHVESSGESPCESQRSHKRIHTHT